MTNAAKNAKPFLKWLGGKRQLIKTFQDFFPKELKNGTITTYYEPFLGGGAVFFNVVSQFPIKKAYLSDINADLIQVYKIVQSDVDKLIEELRFLSDEYLPRNEQRRKEFYYQIRNDYNLQEKNGLKRRSKIKRAAQIIFLNRTGYNGLFRVNSKGEYNVPAGRYKKPRILDENNLRRVSEVLSIAEIEVADYRKIKSKTINKPAFFYFDPPYRPVSRTASFTSYNSHLFGDEEQYGLFEIYHELSQHNHKLMLSNSDPKNVDDNDDFFDDLYHNYQISRVPAHRLVNSNAKKRGHVKEIIVTNYPV